MMSTTHHAEWLSLLDISGPFLSPPVLERVFPQGLDAIDSDLAAKTRRAYDEWADELQKPEPDLDIHDAWIRFVLTETLGYTPEVLVEGSGVPADLAFTTPELGETTRPDFVLLDPSNENPRRPRLLVSAYAPDQDLDGTIEGSRWPASPADRMVQLCRSTNVRLGLVTNGERWMLVDAPKGDTSALASWYANLWGPEPLTLRAFVSLLGLRRFFSVPEKDQLEAMLSESSSYQAEVTDQLGLQVRRAVEVLVEALDKADADTGRRLLQDVPPDQLYEAALTVMMRLVFLFTAEERGLLLLGDPTYDEFYAVSTLRAQLREAADQVGEEVLERRQDAWSRLLATFRAIYGGIHHESLEIVPYGSSLFDPDRFPFLEGRPSGSTWRETEASPLPIDNRTVLLLLESLQLLDLGKKHGARKLSFRALDIEQIGHVYETLLDHTARRATEPMVSLVGARKGSLRYEPELPVARLHELFVNDQEKLIEWLKDETKKTASSLRKAIGKTPDPEQATRLRTACGDDHLFAKLLPFHELIRTDPWGDPVVIPQGAVFVTAGEDRRSTGTHYTPRALTEEIVQYALEPVVYQGPAEGRERSEWELKSPAELLDLKVCDPAMGSGAFLVQACRYLSERLVEAWEQAEPDGLIDAEGNPCSPEDAIPADRDDRLILAKRLIADRCLYGVDINPLAVEMAKLSLWLITLAKDTPFTFLDHALGCGDSLLGVHDEQQFAHFALDVEEAKRVDKGSLFADFSAMKDTLRTAAELRQRLAAMRDRDIYDLQTKTRLLDEADQAVEDARLVGDTITALEIARSSMSNGEYLDTRLALADLVRRFLQTRDPATHATLIQRVNHLLDTDRPEGKPSRRPFHWPVEFPEVFGEKGGFDSMVTNPPFLGGQRISGSFGGAYRAYLVASLGSNRRGSADLAAFFFLRLAELTDAHGTFGAIATNTIGQGDTREVGLDQLLSRGSRIYRAEPAKSWPGGAAVQVSILWLTTLAMPHAVLVGEEVTQIGADLKVPILDGSRPEPLAENAGFAYQGTIVLGKGFMLEPALAEHLISIDPRNRAVLKPYINGKDLNSRPDLSPSRWAIDFDDMSEDQAKTYEAVWQIALRDIKPIRQALDASKYPYRHKYWWRHASHPSELYEAIAVRDRALAVAATSSVLGFAFLPTDLLYSNALYVFVLDRWSDFATLQCIFHDLWVRRFTSSLETRLRYTATDAFETFPRPEATPALEEAGEAFYAARQELMLRESLGLTDVHNRINDPDDRSGEIERLHELWSAMDRAVAEAYGWGDLRLDRVFRTKGGQRRWTLTAADETEVLTRLLELNLQRAGNEA